MNRINTNKKWLLSILSILSVSRLQKHKNKTSGNNRKSYFLSLGGQFGGQMADRKEKNIDFTLKSRLLPEKYRV